MKTFILFILVSITLNAAPEELFYKISQVNNQEVEVTLNYLPQKEFAYLYVPDFVKLISHKKQGKYLRVKGEEVRYRVQGIKNWKCCSGYDPRIKKDFFHLEGANLLVYPKKTGNEKLNIHIEWDQDKTIANSFGIGQTSQHFTASIFDLKRSVFLGGRGYSIETEKIMGSDISYLFLTREKNKDLIKENITKIVKEQRQMYGQNDFNHYLIAVIEDKGRGGGRAFVNGCCLYLSDKSGMDLYWIFSHEHFHNFNGIRVHGQGAREDLTWFIEGFTEFYANRINYKAGIYNEEAYLKNVKKHFNEYEASKERKASYNKILAKKNTNSFCKRFLYVKGHLFAHYLDAEIKSLSNNTCSLDDFMIDVYKSHYPNDCSVSFQKLENIYAKYDDKKLREHLQEFMDSQILLIDTNRAIISSLS